MNWYLCGYGPIPNATSFDEACRMAMLRYQVNGPFTRVSSCCSSCANDRPGPWASPLFGGGAFGANVMGGFGL